MRSLWEQWRRDAPPGAQVALDGAIEGLQRDPHWRGFGWARQTLTQGIPPRYLVLAFTPDEWLAVAEAKGDLFSAFPWFATLIQRLRWKEVTVWNPWNSASGFPIGEVTVRVSSPLPYQDRFDAWSKFNMAVYRPLNVVAVLSHLMGEPYTLVDDYLCTAYRMFPGAGYEKEWVRVALKRIGGQQALVGGGFRVGVLSTDDPVSAGIIRLQLPVGGGDVVPTP